ncbi:hypothetical protein AALP_AA4G063400 [Arabis alpina]|uniref:Uncharacterized protein n=1 Tax=Arabis alpina TaxID=50452 RepID=A0A087H1I5_ARAAL|nr:hypothetical protein AALP_AA4G063400 [Arabis alpina]
MVKVPEGAENIAQQKFRTRNFNDFSAIADAETHLFDVIGHIRHVTGDNLRTHTPGSNPIEVVGNGAKNHVFLHLLMTDGETVRVYLWGNIAENFRQRWNESAVRPIALLITTVNPKTLGGAVNLSSTSASRLFFDKDDAEIEKFLAWLSTGSVPPITPSSSAITKLETLTINELHQFLQHETPQTASFYCFATILDMLDQYGWNYISCSGCKTKLAKTETSLYCTTCKKTNNIGLLRYRFEIAVRDGNNDGATFVVFDGDGIKLAGRRAADLLNEPHQADPDNGNGRITTPLPESLKNIVGRTCKFQITVKPYNFTATRQTFTVSRIVDEAAEMQPLEELNNVEEVKEEDDIVEQNNVEHNNVEEVKEKDDIADKKGKGRCPTADDTDAEAKTAFVAGPPMPTPDSTAKPKDKRPRLGT